MTVPPLYCWPKCGRAFSREERETLGDAVPELGAMPLDIHFNANPVSWAAAGLAAA